MNPAMRLLCNQSPALRSLVLSTLIVDPDTAEVASTRAQLPRDPVIADLVDSQDESGGWHSGNTEWALFRLGSLGLTTDHPTVARGVEYLYSRQNRDGSWPLPTRTPDDGGGRRAYDMVPLQTAIPLIGLAACGCATDPRTERGFHWLLDQRLPDGTWPTGMSGGVFGFVAGYRRLPQSRWGCRSNTTGACVALSMHPELSSSPECSTGVDMILARETRDQALLGFETARLYGFEPVTGFFTRFGRFDPGLALELAVAAGFGSDDPRVSELADWIRSCQGNGGVWHYAAQPNASHWVTYRLLRTFAALDAAGTTTGQRPRTPFSAYPRPPARS